MVIPADNPRAALFSPAPVPADNLHSSVFEKVLKQPVPDLIKFLQMVNSMFFIKTGSHLLTTPDISDDTKMSSDTVVYNLGDNLEQKI